MKLGLKKRIFLDHASTTPVDKRVLKAMYPFFSTDFGNPSALYKEGVQAKNAVKDARTTIARILNVKSDEIIFTANGTEADNMAILGVVQKLKTQHFNPHVVTTSIEHPGILEACRKLEKFGVEVSYIDVEENGIVDAQKVLAAVKENTVLVSVMYANNEIGTIQPLRDIARGLEKVRKDGLPYFHTDASQAANYLSLSFQKLGVDMMTLDASKIYGPKGIGLLAVRNNVTLEPVIVGGGQEKGLRAGTENVAGIVGMAKALEIAESMRESESKRLQELRDYFIDSVIKENPGVLLNGDKSERLPNNISICIPGLDAEFAVIKLDTMGIAASSASSCINLKENSYSYVVDAVPGRGKDCRESTLRFSLGRATKRKDLDLTLRAIRSII